MTKKEHEQKLTEIHEAVCFLKDKITVNGTSGRPAIMGMQNILNDHHGKIYETLDATAEMRARRKMFRAIDHYFEGHKGLTIIPKLVNSPWFLRIVNLALASWVGLDLSGILGH